MSVFLPRELSSTLTHAVGLLLAVLVRSCSGIAAKGSTQPDVPAC
ncbi:MAG: hypothetical protein U0800_09465 [Isosphaeraceae bacterium]